MGSLRLPFVVVRIGLLTLALLFVTALVSSAQDAPQETPTPAHVAFVDGSATLERDGQSESAASGMPLVPGDRLRTTRGRVEVLFPDGSALEVDEFASIELQAPALLRLTSGRILLIVAGVSDPANAQRYQIDTPVASASTEGPGEYRVALLTRGDVPETELAVFRGRATLSTEIGSTSVGAGERTLARDLLAPSHALAFNSARFDAFDRWASARRDARLGTASTRYLPRDLYSYSGTFDRYGSWTYEPPHGYVWYPAVAAGWRPYHHGYWTPLPAYGWTWIGHDVWGWPTHHYGRWGYSRSRWFWIPGFHWGPAWVSWASAPGYVGWCPLGFDGRPLFGLTFAAGNPWAGWVVVSKPHFGHRHAVDRHALLPGSIPARTPFIVHARAPETPGVVVQRPRAIPRPSAGSPAQQSAGRAIAREPNTGTANPPAIAGSQPAATSRSSIATSPPAGRSIAPARQLQISEQQRFVPTTRSPAGADQPISSRRPVTPAPIQRPAPAPQRPIRQDWPRAFAPPPVAPARSQPIAQPRAQPIAPTSPAGPIMRPPAGRSAPIAPAAAPSMWRPIAPPPMARPVPAPMARPSGAPPAGVASPRAAPPPTAPIGAPRSALPPQSAPAQQAPPPTAPAAAPPAGARSPRSR